ncbi:SSI family serine proteinase inhibitor [Nocardia wallacei]|uniref:SSI family serine proteinase inhibitor n=1 Tax=Nocardia wallacei TaxID=480035 RepID=UPI0024567B52|nr:SSI family serine proteinase inhibitor [Nocardia wallacei]
MRQNKLVRASRSAAALVAAAVAGPVLAAAPAHSGTPAPTTLVLTVREIAPDITHLGVRVATLTCSPEVGGNHPRAPLACAELEAADGNLRALTDVPDPAVCPQNFDPLVATISGTWHGAPLVDHGTFSNRCVMQATTKSVFDL